MTACEPTADRTQGTLDFKALKIQLGTGDLAAPGRWCLLRVEARALEGTCRGRVVLRGLDENNRPLAESFEREFVVGELPQTFDLPVLLRRWNSAEVEVAPGGARYRVATPSASLEASHRILFVGRGRCGLRARREDPRELVAECLKLEGPSHVALGRLDAEALPESALAYDPVDLLVLEGTALAEASPRALAAILEWLERGGQLAAECGPFWIAVAPKEALELFGLQREPRPGADPAAPWSVDPKPGLRRLVDGHLLEHRLGNGRAQLVTLPVAGDSATGPGLDPAAVAPSRVLKAWQKVVVGSTRGTRLLDSPLLEGAAQDQLSGWSALSFPARREVGTFVALYVGLGFIGLVLITRRFRRAELGYLLSLIVAAALCVGIYHYGLIYAFRERTLDAVTVAMPRPGSTKADAAQFVALSFPSRAEVALEEILPLARHAVPAQMLATFQLPKHEGFSYSSDPDGLSWLEPLPISLVGGTTPRVPALRIEPNAPRFLRLDVVVQLGGSLTVERRARGELALRNQTPFELEVFLLLLSRGIAALGSCSPGEVMQSPVEADSDSLTTVPPGHLLGWETPENLRYVQRKATLHDSFAFVLWHHYRKLPGLRGCFLARVRDPLLTPAPGLTLRNGETWLVLPIEAEEGAR